MHQEKCYAHRDCGAQRGAARVSADDQQREKEDLADENEHEARGGAEAQRIGKLGAHRAEGSQLVLTVQAEHRPAENQAHEEQGDVGAAGDEIEREEFLHRTTLSKC